MINIANLDYFGKIWHIRMENVFEKINKSATKFLAPLTTDETFKIIVAEAKKIIGGDYGTIFLDSDGVLKRVYADVDFFTFKQRKKGRIYTTFTTMKPTVVDVDSEKDFHSEIKDNGIKSIVHIPLVYKDKAIGVLTVHSLHPKYFSPKDLHLFMLFGALASMAIRKTQLYDETKNALETRDLFISLASHELRTPLTSINGYIQLLHSKLAKKNTVEGKWVIELHAESVRLTNLVKELLEINRIKQGQLQYELRECKVESFLDSAITRYSFINPERIIEYNKAKIPTDLKIIGDSEKLLQMITALISNADKFSPHDLPIIISVITSNTSITIQIKDNGPGIPSEGINKVFDGFYKGERKESEGLGVGLLLAKHIIQYHHGVIKLKSSPKKGTIVEVKLPRLIE